jgi:hypothetical protein
VIILLFNPKLPIGATIGLVIAIFSLPLLAATLPPLLSASATMHRLERRLRAWAHAEPPAMTAETPAASPPGAVLEPGGSA